MLPFGGPKQPNFVPRNANVALNQKAERRLGAVPVVGRVRLPNNFLEVRVATITLPRWVVRQMCMPAGRRNTKKPQVEAATYRGFGVHLGKTYSPPDEHGVFENWEYRFFARASIGEKSHITECRSCGAITPESRNARQEHHKHGGCAKKLTEAYKLLLRDCRCVICDLRTTKTKWGVPMCSSGCEQAWCETEASPNCLVGALMLVPEER